MGANKVSYRFLGKSGIKVSDICLGTMTFGKVEGSRPNQCDESLSHKILQRFADRGGNFIDTADVYSNGLSETIIGTWLQRQNRENFVLATKVRFTTDADNVNGIGLSRKHIIHGLEQSLSRLQTNYIDLYQIHCWDSSVDVKNLLLTLNDLVRSGKVHHIGLSNVTGWQMQKLIDSAHYMGLEQFLTLQVQYNLLCRQTEWELKEVCKQENIAMLPWSPLKGGWLSGKYVRDSKPSVDTRIGWVSEDANRRQMQSNPSYEQFNNEKTWLLLDVMRQVATEVGCSVIQVALRWLLQQDTVQSVIIGAKTIEQLDDNLNASTMKLTEKQMEQLTNASAVDVPYPYEMVWRCQQNRVI